MLTYQRVPRGWLIALAILALESSALVASGANTAAAEVRMVAGGSSPATIAFPRPPSISYALQLSAGDRDETLALEFDAPLFGRDVSGTSPIGASLAFTGVRPRIEGPARLLGPARVANGAIHCGPTVNVHGYDTHRQAWDVLVPAGTTSTLSFDFTPAPSAPWSSTSYDVTFRALNRLVGGGPGSLSVPIEVTVGGPRTSGRRGVQLTLRSTPSTVLAGLGNTAHVRAGHRITVRGTTRPALVNKLVTLWASTLARPSFRMVQRMRTDRRGRFDGAIRARRGLQIMARSPKIARTFAADYSCPLGFDVQM